MKSSIAFFLSEHWRSSACLICSLIALPAKASPQATRVSIPTSQQQVTQFPTSFDLREFQSQFLANKARNKIVLDRQSLKNSIREIVSSMQISPVFGTEVEHNGRPYLRVIATSDSDVWSAVKMDEMASVHCLGKIIDNDDERLDSFDHVLLNGQPLVAYSKPIQNSSQEVIEVIMKSQDALFVIKKAAANSFLIEKLGYIQK